jgi:hypothetical protein
MKSYASSSVYVWMTSKLDEMYRLTKKQNKKVISELLSGLACELDYSILTLNNYVGDMIT